MVDFEAAKAGLVGIAPERVPEFWKVLKQGWYYFSPPLVLIYFLVIQRSSVTMAAMRGIFASASIIIIRALKAPTKEDGKRIIEGLKGGATGVLSPAVACACCGLAILVLVMTVQIIKKHKAERGVFFKMWNKRRMSGGERD